MRIEDISTLIEQEASVVGVPAKLLKKIIFQGENSSFKDDIPTQLISPVGAQGIAQIMPATFKNLQQQGRIGADADVFDPQTNIRAAAEVLQDGLKRYNGNERAAVAHYNGGARQGDPVARGLEPPAEETRSYLVRLGMDAGGGRGFVNPPTTEELLSAVTRPETKTTTTYHGKVTPLSADAMSEQTRAFIAKNAALSDMLDSMIGKATATSDQAAQAEIDAGKAASDAITAKGNQVASNAQRKIDALQFFDATMSPDGAMIKARQAHERAVSTMDALRPQIEAENNITIFDDPLRWLINQFTLPQLKGAYNDANKLRDTKEREIASRQALVASQQAIDTGVTADQVRATATAEAAAKSFEAVKEAAKLHMQSQSQVAQMIMQRAHLASSDLNAWQTHVRLFADTYAITEAKKADEALRPTLDSINVQRSAVGLAPYSVAEFKMLRPEERADAVRRSKLPPGVLGGDPGDTLRFVQNNNALNTLMEKNPTVAKMLGSQLASKEFKTLLDQKKSTDPRFMALPVEEQYSKVLEELSTSQLQEVRKIGHYDRLDPNNPYALKIGSAAQYSELKDNMFMPVVNDELKRGGYMASVRPEALEQTAVAKAMEDPSKIPEISKQLSEFYRTAQTQQWIRSGAAVVGYARPMEWKTSTMTVGGKPVDQWNPANIEQWLLVKKAAMSRSAMGEYLYDKLEQPTSPDPNAAPGVGIADFILGKKP